MLLRCLPFLLAVLCVPAQAADGPPPSDWGQPAVDLMRAVPPRVLDDSVGARDSGSAESRLWIANTDFRLHDDIGFFIRRMLIQLRPLAQGTPLLLDDPKSMEARIEAGDIFVADATLGTLLNQDLRAAAAPVRNLELLTRADGQEVRGELLRKGRWRPLRMLTGIELAGPLMVALVPKRIFVDGVDVTPSLNAASIDMSEVLTLETRHMRLIGNRILVDLDGLFPPPRLDFQVRELRLADGGMDLRLGGDLAALAWPELRAPDSYMFIEGGDIKMARTILVKAYALFTSLSPRQPLLFNLYDYRRQLQYGEIRLREDGMVHIAVSPVKAPAPGRASL
ncbi:hypothetical protein [Zestomonas carbonaria]|uniref:Uncharacterized protein n=1 Tax=Zestomonas carbonaria TaxID=2762745 RepID=A0A7U7EJD4_9GAMM|nr:hypothetical protein [Pseudomonas carbonaria]CAD5106067.1 hypothetical protein PSEWESI4_00326 [Pseudomonas carbonaria]